MMNKSIFGGVATPFDNDPQPQTQPGQPLTPRVTNTPRIAPDNRQRDRQRLRMAVAGLQASAPQNTGSPLGAFANIFNAGAQGYGARKLGEM